MNWVLFWLVLHVGAAVIGLGPAFCFPFIGFSAEREPQHTAFAVGVIHLITKRLILPLAGTMLVSGIGLIIAAGINPLQSPWLLAGIALYLVVMGLATGHQLPTAEHMLLLLREAASKNAPPPPEALRLRERARNVGMATSAILVVIIVLMVVKPGGTGLN